MGHPTTFRKVWIQPRTGLRHSSPLSFSIGLSIPWMVFSRKTVAHTLLSWPLCVRQTQRGTVTCPRSQSKVSKEWQPCDQLRGPWDHRCTRSQWLVLSAEVSLPSATGAGRGRDAGPSLRQWALARGSGEDYEDLKTPALRSLEALGLMGLWTGQPGGEFERLGQVWGVRLKRQSGAQGWGHSLAPGKTGVT